MTMNTIQSVQHRNIHNEPIDNPKLALIEAVCISWFTIEYLLRLAGMKSRLRDVEIFQNTISVLFQSHFAH